MCNVLRVQFLANEHYENVQKQNKKIVVSNKHLKIFILVPDGVSKIWALRKTLV